MRTLLLFILLSGFIGSCNDVDEKSEVTETSSSVTAREKELQEVVAKYPDSALAVESLAKYYDSAGNYQAAINTIQTRLKKDSLNPHWYDIIGWLYYQKDDTTNAIKAYEQAIELFPDPQYVITLGALYAGKKNDKALAMADALLMAPGANAIKEAWFIKGLYFSNIGDKQKAINFFDKCLAESYTFANAYLEKGNALFALGKYDEAVKVFDKGIAVQNNYPDAYFAKGKALEKLNKKTEAEEAYKMALMYDSEYAEAQNALQNLEK